MAFSDLNEISEMFARLEGCGTSSEFAHMHVAYDNRWSTIYTYRQDPAYRERERWVEKARQASMTPEQRRAETQRKANWKAANPEKQAEYKRLSRSRARAKWAAMSPEEKRQKLDAKKAWVAENRERHNECVRRSKAKKKAS